MTTTLLAAPVTDDATRRQFLAGGLAAGLLLGACGRGGESVTPAPAPSSDGFPVTITHALDTTTIPARPTRIVALSFEQDVLSQVGLMTVGHADNIYAQGALYPWQEGEVDLTDSTVVTNPAGGADLERIAALRPDLILATNYFGVEDVYPQLSGIAPTVAYETGWGGATWQETSTVIGRAVGKEAEVAAAMAEVDGYLAAMAAEYPGLRGKTFASVYYYESGKFAVNTDPDGQTARVLGQLGMVLDPRIAAEVVDRSLSLEQLGLLDVDLLGIGFASPELKADLTKNPLFAGLAVVRDGRVNESDNFGATAGNNPTLLNISWQLERQRAVLSRVASMPA